MNEQIGLVGAIQACQPGEPPQLDPNYKVMDRKRLTELISIANKVLDVADAEGVKPNERCKFGEICQLLWRY